MCRIGYGKYMSHLGRHLRDFLLNLDNFHDYLKFSFPRMRAPSFFIDQETETSTQKTLSLYIVVATLL